MNNSKDEKMSNLKLFRLNNGDDIIGFLETYSTQDIAELDAEENAEEQPHYEYENIVFIRDPMRIIWNYDTKTKGHQLFLTRWMPFSDDGLFAIPKDKVITICDPMPEVEKHYHEVTGEETKAITEGIPEKDQIIPEDVLMTKEEQEKMLYLDWLKDWDPKDEPQN